MGGLGSGRRWGSGGPTCESYLALDIRKLVRDGYLTPGTSFWMRWYSHDEEIGSIRLLAQDSSIELIYRARSYGGEWQDMREVVRLTYTRPHLGGDVHGSVVRAAAGSAPSYLEVGAFSAGNATACPMHHRARTARTGCLGEPRESGRDWADRQT